LIQRLNNASALKNEEAITEDKISDENTPGESETNKDDNFVGFVRDGVEVVDVKIVPKDVGIPIKGTRKTWDKI